LTRKREAGVPERAKVFWFFFSKKNCFLAFLGAWADHTIRPSPFQFNYFRPADSSEVSGAW
jgi:hypothetical protein